ncbi:MAG: hypothetical protein ABIX28_09125 [Vicinamibacterales bacterium]
MLIQSRRQRTVSTPLAALAVLALLSTAGCDIVTADLKSQATADWTKRFTLEPGGRLEIENVNGRIHVTPSEGNEVEVIAQKKAKAVSEDAAKAALAQIQIEDTVSGSTIRVQTKVPRSNGLMGGSAEVSYTVRVPASAEVKFLTVNGGIEISRLSGKIDAETTNGEIVAREISGPIEATTTNGGVEVELTAVAKGGVKLGCTNGGIKLRLPADAAATISASVANGGIDTDGLQLEKSESSRRNLEARLNGGGPSIKIEGTNGGITIRSR